MLHIASRRFISVVLLGLFPAVSALASQSLKVNESVTLAAKPAEVWKVLGDYGKLNAWHPVVAKSEITQGKNNQVGAIRALETKDGARIVEELLNYDARKMSMRYKFIESPLPVTDYQSSLRVVPSGKGSRVVWQGTFKAKGVEDAKAREIFIGIYKAGFDGLRQQLGE
jgi:mxaD protein